MRTAATQRHGEEAAFGPTHTHTDRHTHMHARTQASPHARPHARTHAHHAGTRTHARKQARTHAGTRAHTHTHTVVTHLNHVLDDDKGIIYIYIYSDASGPRAGRRGRQLPAAVGAGVERSVCNI